MAAETVITLEPYQEPAVEWLTRRRRGIVRCRAGGGKTIIAAAALHRVFHAKPREEPIRVGWIANTLEQVEQAWAALAEYPMDAAVCVACAQGEPDMSEVDILVVDECHHSLSPLWRGIIDRTAGALWGFTATPHADNPDLQKQLVAMFGGTMYEIPPEEVGKRLASGRVRLLTSTDEGLRELIDTAIETDLAPAVRQQFHFKRPELWRTHWPEFKSSLAIEESNPDTIYGAHKWKADQFLKKKLADEIWPRIAYRKCQEIGIATNERRNQAIIETANRHVESGDTVLGLVNNKEHGAALAQYIPGACVAHSKMGVKKRRDAVAALRDGSLRCMIATSMADEGFDCPRASVLVMACGGKAAGRVEQRSGRVLRKFQGKEEGVIYDFTDTFHPLAAKQAKKRLAVYRELGYAIELPAVSDARQPSLL